MLELSKKEAAVISLSTLKVAMAESETALIRHPRRDFSLSMCVCVYVLVCVGVLVCVWLHV